MNREAVYEQLKIDEGVVYGIYNDHLGYPTFGVGHLIVEDDEEYEGQLEQQLLKKESGRVSLVTLTLPKENVTLYTEKGHLEKLPDEVQQILVNMMFNMGRPRLSKFKKMNEAMAQKDWKRAAVEGRDFPLV